jgi:hypothetical protein
MWSIAGWAHHAQHKNSAVPKPQYTLVQSLCILFLLSDSFVQNFSSFTLDHEQSVTEYNLKLGASNSTIQALEHWVSAFSLPDATSLLLHNISTITDPATPVSLLNDSSTGSSNVDVSSSVKPNDTLRPSRHSNGGTSRHDNSRHTRDDSNASNNPTSLLHEQFVDTMKAVHQLPPGERPANALFTPFFTKGGDKYVCLLCPAKTAKALVNRTQIIQHIAGGHGEARPFVCPSW